MLEDILRSHATSFIDSWSSHLPMAEFAINNSVHVSTGYTPFYLNTLRHPRIPVLLSGVNSNFSGGETQANVVSTDVTNHIVLQGEEKHLSDKGNQVYIRVVYALSTNTQTNASIISDKKDDDLLKRQANVRFVRDSIAESVDKQKEQIRKEERTKKPLL